MYLKASYDDEFDDIYMHLKAKYPKKLFDLDGIGEQIDLQKFSKKFFSKKGTTADVSIDSNANVGSATIVEYEHELPKPFLKLNSYYILWKYLRQYYGTLLANEIFESVVNGNIYIHDFTGFGSSKSYCFNFSTLDIVLQGLPMIEKIKSIPPKYLYSFKSQIEQFITIASNSILGATGLADLFVSMAMFVDQILDTKQDAHFTFASEEDIWKYVEENIISLIYTLNQPLRSSVQSPFTNVSIYDLPALENLVMNYMFPETGKTPNIKTIQKIQEIFLDIMNNEQQRTPITFPVTTAVITVDKDNNVIDTEFLDMMVKKNKQNGFINFFVGESGLLSSCCRLRSDVSTTEETFEKFNSFGAGNTRIGSLGVVTLNLPRYAKIAKGNEDTFFELVEHYQEMATKINETKRKLIRKRINNGNQPLYSYEFMDLDRQYSTVGVIGINEAVEMMGLDILHNGGSDFVLKLIMNINKTNDRASKKYASKFNCEQIPGENSSIKLVKKDKLLGFLTEEDDYALYSNQFIPLIVNTDVLNRIYLQGLFDKHFSGGSILHINVEQMPQDENATKELIKYCVKSGVVYFALNTVLNLCVNGHISTGKIKNCSVCQGEISDVFTRVVGFLTNTKHWSKERREIDYPQRKWYHDNVVETEEFKQKEKTV